MSEYIDEMIRILKMKADLLQETKDDPTVQKQIEIINDRILELECQRHQ